MKKFDFIIILFIVLIALGLFVAKEQKSASKAVIKVNGDIYAEYSLNTDRNFLIKSEFGENRIIIKNGKLYVTESSCKDKIEIASGEICKKGQSLICLPNRLIITLEGEADTVVNTY